MEGIALEALQALRWWLCQVLGCVVGFLEGVGGCGAMEFSPGRRVLHGALRCSLLVGGSQSPALGIRGSQA